MSSCDDDAPPPSYPARHMTLGFDSDDVAALINSINSSQHPRTSTLPHLPAEVLFQILEFVPVDHVLTWRLVCRGFRDAIDGPVQYEHLKRAELIGYLGPRAQYPLDQLGDSCYEQINFIRAHFERVDDSLATHESEPPPQAKRHVDQAIFTIDDAWYREFSRLEQNTTQDGIIRPAWQSLLDDLQLLGDVEGCGTLKWCLRLDKAVLDLDFSPESLRNYIAIDLASRKILLQWKDVFWNFLKTEAMLRELMEEAKHCLREVRRQRIRADLDLDKKDHRLLSWRLSVLPPLFGRSRYNNAPRLGTSVALSGFENLEDDAIQILTLLRKEASMSRDEITSLEQLRKDRLEMERDLEAMSTAFGDWRSKLFGVSAGLARSSTLPKLPPKLAAWSDELKAREEARVKTWQTQRRAIGQLALVLNGSIEAMSLPEDAFDDCESDL
ncbi:hypothetical protein K458DRAFT_446332 [Lentithecium fluviatile CBS 122367]|uniref:F-box domain-containing protein n=1 Tax=Lentithecium fluviatile CBS 122367 TaxID=1168545 RepID=A0A6G1IJY5_9PLEO|nr:hypothetical protein K458DRAFT_446332 [Lentithecium fluviatile CBS 122367]